MENSILLLIFCVFLCKSAASEKIGPAIVIRNDDQQQSSNTNSPSGPPRTTTVYGFLDFTTTIDNTVVVFRPSSASVKSPATVSISSSKSQEATLPIAATKTRQVLTATVTLHSNQNRTVIRKDRPIITQDKVDKSARGGGGERPLSISPTPTIARTKNVVQGSRRVTSSSIAEKRRRFLAIARGQRPDGPPPSAKNNVATVQTSGDQEMAESIEVTPSKIKRFQSLSNYSTMYALPGGLGRERGGGGVGRILVRKLQRRLGRQPIENADKSQVVAFRRPSSKLNLLTVAGSRAREDVAEPNVELASSLNSISSSEASSELDVSSRSLTSSSSDGSAATITEYVHDGAEVGAESGPLQSSILPLSSNEDSEIGASAAEDLEASQTDAGSLSSVSVAGSSDGATVPLPVLNAATDKNDIGLTVPLQLSIVTSTFSLTETSLRTSLLPVYDGTSTTFYTLTHSFVVTKTVTTFQTVPPEEYMHYLIPGNDTALNSLNDVLPELESMPPSLLQRKSDLDEDGGPHTNDPEDVGSDELLEKAGTVSLDVERNDPKADTATTSGDAATTNPAFQQQMAQPVNPLLGNLPFLNLLGPAAALGLNPYFPYGLGIPQVLTTSRPVFSTDVVYTSKLLPIIDGLTTTFRTLHEAASTITRTSYETFTTQVANQNPLAGLGGNNLQQTGPQGMSTVTSPHTFITTETQTDTQVFKLMYDGYKTSYRTVSSTSLITRTITTHTTTTVPIYNTMMPFFG